MAVELKEVALPIPEGANLILGQSHFIKTVEDLYECLAESGTALRFGIAFSEASGKRLVRTDGNDPELTAKAASLAMSLSCGHSFIILLKNGFPVNVLDRVKSVSEVCTVFCATANPVAAIVAETESGRGVMGVVDGQAPLGVETDGDKAERTELLKKIGYKR